MFSGKNGLKYGNHLSSWDILMTKMKQRRAFNFGATNGECQFDIYSWFSVSNDSYDKVEWLSLAKLCGLRGKIYIKLVFN